MASATSRKTQLKLTSVAKASLEELAERAIKQGSAPLPGSGKQEYLEGVINDVLFG